jgi:membrane associated rhomboid family serine protease
MGEKLRTIFLPVLLLMAALAALFSLLNWALVIKTGWLPLDENVAALWLPVAFAMVGVGFFLAPRLHILAFTPKRNFGGLYLMVAVLIVAGPTILVQKFLQGRVGEMASVTDAAVIAQHPEARFFTLGSVCLNKHGVPWHPRIAVAGDHDEDLNVDLYYAVPFCGTQVYLGLEWHRTLDNRLAEKKKDALFEAFLKDADRDLTALDPRAIRYFERVGRNDLRRVLQKALADGKHKVAAPIFVIAHNEPFAPQGDVWGGGAILAVIAGAVLWLLMLLIVPVLPVEERKPAPPGGGAAFFVPHRESFGLPILIDINLLVYLAMVMSGLGFLDFELDDLIAWGASSAGLDHGWGLVRLSTATFVHAGLFHILGNMYGLLIGGAMLSLVARNLRLLFTYIVSGIGGSLLSLTVNPDIVTVGASGAIFGFFGALVALVVLRDAKIYAIRKAILFNVGIFVGLNLVYGFSTPGVDNFAHIGGFLTGLLCGAVIYFLDRREARAIA